MLFIGEKCNDGLNLHGPITTNLTLLGTEFGPDYQNIIYMDGITVKSLMIKKNNQWPHIYYIGVTGHRVIEDEDLIRGKVRAILEGIEAHFSNTNHILKVISPLAEGADRLVAKEVLFFHGCPRINEMRVVLPLEMHDYMNDFKTIESKMEFEELNDLAREIVTLPEAPTREDAYLQVGKYVADECDVLIAIWDSKPSKGKGGTAEIVAYAQSIGRQVIWINSVNGKISQI